MERVSGTNWDFVHLFAMNFRDTDRREFSIDGCDGTEKRN